MKKLAIKIINLIIVITLVSSLAIYVEATSIGEIQQNINKDNEALKEINDALIGLQDEQDLIEEEISDLDAELLNTMTAIGMLEDDIALKEADILIAQEEYEEAKRIAEEQYQSMIANIQFIYESGDIDYLSALLEAKNFSDMLNMAVYVEAIHEYDQNMLAEFEAAQELVGQLWDKLETEKASLEVDRANMVDQQVYLDGLLARKKEESANYEAQIARARQEASALKVKLKQEQAALKKLQDEEKKKNAASGSYAVTPSVSSIIDNASGSTLGKQIARYGCQYIGNPYVLGGTSLTSGADCSGFTYRIYADFGYKLSRTSYQQRSAGTEVSYENVQPGDLICYEGHVALYIGGGYIVHASTAKTGIKLSRAGYRPILSVRRIL